MLGKEKIDSDSDQSLSKDNVHLLVSLKKNVPLAIYDLVLL
jgi:hypothetical protein